MIKGEEKFVKKEKPITDLVYFCASINEFGKTSKIVDKAIIMSYDEHYSGGPPGAICSLN